MIDRDEDAHRQSRVEEAAGRGNVTTVVALAKEEFEAWLASDPKAFAAVTGSSAPVPPEPDAMPRGEAKNWLRSIIGGSNEAELRKALARAIRLEQLQRLSAFERFSRNLGRALPSSG